MPPFQAVSDILHTFASEQLLMTNVSWRSRNNRPESSEEQVGCEGGTCYLLDTRHLGNRSFQFGSRVPIYQLGVYDGTPNSWHSDQHGRAGTMLRSYKDGTFLVGVEMKYVNIKIKECVSFPQLRFGVQHYVNFYNSRQADSFDTSISNAG